jgi:sorbitol/mannitol transport system permease protein
LVFFGSVTVNHRLIPRILLAPAVLTLFLWMIVPLVMTLYFSVIRYNLMQPENVGFIGLANYEFFITDPSFWPSVVNTLLLLGSVIAITPFFVMPTVNALLWKHMMMNPIYGVLAQVWIFFGAEPVDWLTDWPLLSIIIMISWQWLPFATLIFMTALMSLNREQLEASRMDGATYLQQVRYMYLPHLGRSMAVVIMIEMIFLISVFAEIFTTTGGGPGDASTNMAFLIFKQALLNFDAGVASAGALFAVILANIAAIFLIRMIGKNLD